MPEFGHPNRYTGLPNGLNTSLQMFEFLIVEIKRVGKWGGGGGGDFQRAGEATIDEIMSSILT